MAIATFLKYVTVSKDRRITEIYIKSNDTAMPVVAKGYLFIVDKLKTIAFNNEQVLNQNEVGVGFFGLPTQFFKRLYF